MLHLGIIWLLNENDQNQKEKILKFEKEEVVWVLNVGKWTILSIFSKHIWGQHSKFRGIGVKLIGYMGLLGFYL